MDTRLRLAAGLDEDKTDQELLAEAERSEETVLTIQADAWRQIRDIPGLILAILEAAEAGGATAVLAGIALAQNRSRHGLPAPYG